MRSVAVRGGSQASWKQQNESGGHVRPYQHIAASASIWRGGVGDGAQSHG